MFVTCKIEVASRKGSEVYEDLGIEDPSSMYVDLNFKPESVIAYREDPALDDRGAEGVVFSLPNEEYYTEMSIHEFEELINANG